MIQVLAGSSEFISDPEFVENFTCVVPEDNRIWIDTYWEDIKEAREYSPNATFRKISIHED